MKESETLEDLEAMRRGLLEKHLPADVLRQLEAIQVTIDLFRSSSPIPKLTGLQLKPSLPERTSANSGASIQEDVIDTVLSVMEKNGNTRIKSKQILDYLTENKLFVDKWNDPSTRLGSILFSESEKKTGRLKKVGRGKWEKRQEKTPTALMAQP